MLKADTVSACASTSAWLASVFARVALVAAFVAATSDFTSVAFSVSGFTVSGFIVSEFTVSGFTVSGFTVSGFTVSGFIVSGLTVSGFTVSTVSALGSAFSVSLSPWLEADVVIAVSADCTSVADTTPLPKNIKPTAIATDAAPKLNLRIP